MMKANTITLYEDRQTKLNIGREQYQDLLSFKGLLGSQNFIFQADGTLLLKHYVGFIANNQIKLQVLPKIYEEYSPGELIKERDEAMQVLLRLLSYSGYIRIKEIPQPQNIRLYQSDLLEIYISIFVSRFLQLFLRDVHRKYELYQANMQFIKGKLLFQETIRKNAYHDYLHYVQYDEFTINTTLNKIFKTVMQRLLSKTSSSTNKKNLKKALIYLEEVDTIRLSKTLFEKVQFNRINESYHPLLNMARMFYYNLTPGFHEGDEYTFTFLIPLNDLFEYFVYKLLYKSYNQDSSGKEVLYQNPRLKLAKVNGKGEFTLKPDITIKENGEIKIILDAKYKNPDQGISQADVYQILTYALRYKCNRLFLVYPAFNNTQKAVEIINTYIISTDIGDIELSSVQIDLREKDIALLQREFGLLTGENI